MSRPVLTTRITCPECGSGCVNMTDDYVRGMFEPDAFGLFGGMFNVLATCGAGHRFFTEVYRDPKARTARVVRQRVVTEDAKELEP